MRPHLDQSVPFVSLKPFITHVKVIDGDKSEEQKRSRAYLDGFDDGYDEGKYQFYRPHGLRWFALGYAVAIAVVVIVQRVL